MANLLKRFQTLALLPDWILIQRAKLGEKEAFGKLYEKYLDKIYRYIFFRVGQNKYLAEDLVQTVFLKAWEKLETFKEGSFQAWIYTIARNTIVDNMRTTKQQVAIDENLIDEKENVEETVGKKLDIKQAMNAVKVLTDEQQEVILLRFVNDLSFKEIAKILDKKEDAVRAMQYRAIKELRSIIAGEMGLEKNKIVVAAQEE